MEGTPFGRYRLVKVLGRGGMGEVWRGFDTVTERIVAVKVLPVHLAGDEGFQQRFLREAKAAASLNEPHVVPIYDFGEIDNRLFVAMRLVDGHDLQDLLANGPLSPDRAVAIIEQIASALDAAHRIGLIHRDVKPSNILVAEDDFAYLIDFGIARVAGETGLTSTGMTLGTWPYMAPERFRTGTGDARADVYALTCVLHQSLTGQQPFPGDSLEQIATGHMFDPPPRPSAIRGSIPAALDGVIATGMAKEPNQRFPTTKALAQAARAALATPFAGGFAVSPGRATPPTGQAEPVKRAATPPQTAYPVTTAMNSPAVSPPGLDRVAAQYLPTKPAQRYSPTPATQAPESALRRPWTVTAAAIIAVLWSAAYMVTGLSFFLEGIPDDVDEFGYTRAASVNLAMGSCVTALALAWGATTAFRGTSRKGLFLAPLIFVTFALMSTLMSVAGGGYADWELLLGFFIFGVLLLTSSLLTVTSSSKKFFDSRARRG